MAHLREVPQLRRLRFGDRQQQVTSVGLANLRFLIKLQSLDMSCFRTTDADLQYVQGLTQMEELLLGGGITDAGLVHLRRLTKLKKLVPSVSQGHRGGREEAPARPTALYD